VPTRSCSPRPTLTTSTTSSHSPPGPSETARPASRSPRRPCSWTNTRISTRSRSACCEPSPNRAPARCSPSATPTRPSTAFAAPTRRAPGAVVLALGRSYRSSDTILNAASQLVAVTPERRRPRLWSGIAGAPHILVVSARDESAEAERVALLVERLLGGTGFLSFDSGLVDGARDTPDLSFADIAVLYRLRRQGESFAEALGRRGLPVDLGGGATEDPDERLVEATAALRLVAGRCDPAAARLLDDRGLTARLEPWRAAAKAAATAVVDDVLAALAPGDRGAAPLAILRRAARRVDAARERRRRTDSRAGAPTRPLDDVIEWLALHAPRDQGDRPSDRVSLLTLHAAKGLEWKVVIVAGCEDGLIPLRRGSSPVDVDEERRLLFVGLTRARHLLVLSRAERRTLWGERRASSPSPFVADIAANLLRVEPSGATETPRHRNAQLDLF
jgi:superfamily I DNA/RNA helicase